MNRTQADLVAGIVVAAIVTVGILTAVQLGTMDQGTMGGMDAPPVMRSVAPILGSLVVASVVGGMYVYARGQLFAPDDATPTDDSVAASDASAEPADGADRAASGGDGRKPSQEGAGQGAMGDAPRRAQVLDVLPEDERRVLKPVLESPGLTQIKVRDRSGFSKSKVSQTVTDLEARGLLYRERQGRTYCLYPVEDLVEEG